MNDSLAKKTITLILITWPALFSACTSEQVYRNIQQDHLRECQRLPIYRQVHCISLNDTPYEEYRRELEAIQRD